MMNGRIVLRIVIATAVGIAAAWLSRRRYRNWGATREEIARAMPLDDLVPDAWIVTTRAVTIHARPEQVWPWIVQIGEVPRAGYYSYTWVERLQGLHVENANRILPEFQTLHVGDYLDKAGDMLVLDVEPGRHLVLGPPDKYDWLRCTWVLALYPEGSQSSRLVTRLRARMGVLGMMTSLPPWIWPFWFVIDPGVFIMERKMLTGIRDRAERGVARIGADQ